MHNDPSRWTFAGTLGTQPLFLRLASHYTTFMTRRIDEAFKAAEEQLFERMSETHTQDVQDQFAAMQELRERGADLRGRLTSALGEPLRQYCRLADGAGIDLDPGARRSNNLKTELRLVDDEDLDESLAWEHMVDWAEGHYRIGLHALKVRLGSLAGLGELNDEQNPVSPAVIAKALRPVIDSLDCTVQCRLEIVDVFEKKLVRRLGSIFDALNQMLMEAGIVPHLEWKIPRDRDGEGESEQDSDHESETRREQQFLDGWLYGTIQWLLSERRRQQGDLRDENSPGIDTGSLSDALAVFQRELVANERAGFTPLDRIKEELVDHVRARSGSDGPNQIGVVDENVLDSIGLMFDFVSQDNQLPEPFQLALGKLQIPFLKAALRNPEMITSGDAPAKRLLNNMAEIGMGWNRKADRGLHMLKKVQEIVQRVVHEYHDNDELFEELLADLETFQLKIKRRAEIFERRQSEAMAGRERLNLARRDVSQAIMTTIGERQVPELVSDILRKPWSQVMVLALLRHGQESEQWKKLMNFTQELVWSVSIEPEPDNVQRLRTRIPVLGKALVNGLRKVGYHDDEIKGVLANLKRIYVSLVKQTGSDRIVVEQTAEGVTIRGEAIDEFANDDSVPRMDDAETLGEALNIVEGWREGRWVLLRDTEDDEPMRAKLSWISPMGRYLFVDQCGMKAGERTRAQLAEEILAHKVEPLDEEGLFTRALNKIADELKDDVSTKVA